MVKVNTHLKKALLGVIFRNTTEGIDEDVLGILDFPELRQTNDFDCGITCLQEVLCYYGIDVRESLILDDLMSEYSDIADNGIKLSALKEYAEKKGLKAEIKIGMTPVDLISFIEKKLPVIVLLQAWRDEKSPDNWKDDYLDGHYVVAIGYTKDKIIFEDPSSFNRTYLVFSELLERWHDLADDNETHISGAGVIISGIPDYKSNVLSHMD